MSTAGETISVECACGKRLKAPASAVGRRAKCPACANVLTIELPPPPPEVAEEDDALGAMYDLAETEKAAAQSNQLDESPRCPKCAAAMLPGAVLCTSCGFDSRSNKKITTAKAAAAPPIGLDYSSSAKKKPRDKMAPDGSFLIGLLASFGCALGGGLVWFLVTWGTGYDIYYVCLLIGVCAGIGMQIGQKGFSTVGGWAAAGVALLVLLMARLAVVVAILLPMIQRIIAREQAAAAASSSQVSNTSNGAQSSNGGGNSSTPSAAYASSSSSSSPSSASATSSAHKPNISAALGGLVILLIFFGWKSSIFMILTLAIAYRTASGSVSG